MFTLSDSGLPRQFLISLLEVEHLPLRKSQHNENCESSVTCARPLAERRRVPGELLKRANFLPFSRFDRMPRCVILSSFSFT